MKLGDAVNSGKKIKRQSVQGAFGWLSQLDDGCVYLYTDETHSILRLQLEDLIADDWMIDEKMIAITKTLFIETYEAALKSNPPVSFFSFRDHLIKELGLE